MRTSLWLVIVVVVAWIGFLLGYAASSHTGTKGRAAEAPAAVPAGAAGYGAPAAGYGK